MQSNPTVLRLGSVSYLNAKPLIYGLENAADLHLALDVPSRLLDGLSDGRFDVALLPIIDYQRLPNLRLLTSGGIGSDGPALTVRIFSKVPIERITALACDIDSHTSVALARVLLGESFGLKPEFLDLNTAHPSDVAGRTEARLLIGDKVVCDEPAGFPYQLDLGDAWKNLTGLPFVFAAWIARPGVPLRDLPDRLEQAKQAGRSHIDQIIQEHAIPRGWPAALARQYLTQNLKYDLGQPERTAIETFHRLAGEYGLVKTPVRTLDFV